MITNNPNFYEDILSIIKELELSFTMGKLTGTQKLKVQQLLRQLTKNINKQYDPTKSKRKIQH